MNVFTRATVDADRWICACQCIHHDHYSIAREEHVDDRLDATAETLFFGDTSSNGLSNNRKKIFYPEKQTMADYNVKVMTFNTLDKIGKKGNKKGNRVWKTME